MVVGVFVQVVLGGRPVTGIVLVESVRRNLLEDMVRTTILELLLFFVLFCSRRLEHFKQIQTRVVCPASLAGPARRHHAAPAT